MADITITPANVITSADAVIERGTAGATITAGQLVYLDTVTSTYKLADANGASPLFVIRGIALHGASSGQPLAICTEDPALVIGATVAVGATYIASATPGGIGVDADGTTGWYKTIVGVGKTVTTVNFKLIAAGAAA